MLDWILQNGTTLLAFGGYAMFGIFAAFGYFNRQDTTRTKESDQLADTLIKRLQQTVDQQAKDLARMDTDMKAHTEKRDVEIKKLQGDLSHLTGRNSVLEDLFKGRDPGMQMFLKEAPELIRVAQENNVLGKSTAVSVKIMADAMTTLIEHLGAPTPAPQLELHNDTL